MHFQHKQNLYSRTPSVSMGSIIQHLTSCMWKKGPEKKIYISRLKRNCIKDNEGLREYGHILFVFDSYYISQSVVKKKLIRSIEVDTINKSRKSDHFPNLKWDWLEPGITLHSCPTTICIRWRNMFYLTLEQNIYCKHIPTLHWQKKCPLFSI